MDTRKNVKKWTQKTAKSRWSQWLWMLGAILAITLILFALIGCE